MEQPLHTLIVGRKFDQFQIGLLSQFDAKRLGYSYEYCHPTDNSALIVHFDTELYLGRITTWTRGTCHLEVLEVTSGKTILDRHYDLPQEEAFLERLIEIALFIETRLKTEQGS